MSQPELPLNRFSVDIDAHSAPGSTFYRLAELADRIFTRIEHRIGPLTSAIPPGVKIASIAWSGQYTENGPLPIRAALHQIVSGMQVQRVTVDFQAQTVECQGPLGFLPIERGFIDRAQDEIKPHLGLALGQRREREEAQRAQERIDWGYFCRRLKSNGVLLPENFLLSDVSFIRKLCPLCKTQTMSCMTCRAIMCLNSACAASQVLPFRSCSQHVSSVSCLPCIESEEVGPSIGQCPGCQLWFCGCRLTWCLGRPKDGSMASPSRAREHPAKPTRCSTCAGGRSKLLCANEDCWSKRRDARIVIWVPTRTYELCSPEGGLSCACERCWLCDDCETSSTVEHFKRCPRCKAVYCVKICRYIRHCAECGRATACDDCIEEDWSSFAGPDVPVTDEVVLKGKCNAQGCYAKICGECLERTQCAGCSMTFCSLCMRTDGSRLCMSCRRSTWKEWSE